MYASDTHHANPNFYLYTHLYLYILILSSKEAAKAVRKRLKSKHINTQLLTITVSYCMVDKNINTYIQFAVGTIIIR